MRNKKGEINIGTIVILFVGIIFAIALLAPIADTTSLMTKKQSVLNQTESVVLANVNANEANESINFTIFTQSVWKQQSCALSSVTIRNGAGTSLVADTDYTLYAGAGVFSLLNTSLTVPQASFNLTHVDFTYCADGYNTSSGSRSIANLVIVFAVLALLGFVLDKSGVVDMSKLIGN